MTRRDRATVPAFLALALALVHLPASAAEPGCTSLGVEADAAFRARFPEWLDRVQNELRARADVDPCARVELGLTNDGTISVAVTLADGRSASRRITRADDVIPTLEGLLLVPDPPPAAADEPPAATPVPASQPRPAPRVRWTRGESAEESPPHPGSRQLGFELSAVTGARIGDGQVGYGAGLLSFIQIGGWLIGFQGRADGYRALHGSDPETALELAILGGRRFDFGKLALDLSVGSAIVMNGVTFSETQATSVEGTAAMMPPPSPEPESSGPVPRLLLGARLGMSPRSVFRTFVGVDGEVGPRAFMGPREDASSPHLPSFSVGLALGATVGTL